ncbi:MAG TPA: hypothetical protein VMT38_02535 [Terracidiphilus sp.]|nr:hypothetical protein [Terracidiphilus sp.]
MDTVVHRGIAMLIVHLIEWFFGGAFFANSVPHIVNGISGRPFQSPFAKPPGQGLSSSTVNVLWGFLNLVFAYVLLIWLGQFNIHFWLHVVTAGAGALLLSVMMARHFGRFHSGLL